jgi:hypothetical protein
MPAVAGLLEERAFCHELMLSEPAADGEAVLVVQLSDLRFNERVDHPFNRDDFSSATARLVKLATRVNQLGHCDGVSKVVGLSG